MCYPCRDWGTKLCNWCPYPLKGSLNSLMCWVAEMAWVTTTKVGCRSSMGQKNWWQVVKGNYCQLHTGLSTALSHSASNASTSIYSSPVAPAKVVSAPPQHQWPFILCLLGCTLCCPLDFPTRVKSTKWTGLYWKKWTLADSTLYPSRHPLKMQSRSSTPIRSMNAKAMNPGSIWCDLTF